jgi:hypothetical protein
VTEPAPRSALLSRGGARGAVSGGSAHGTVPRRRGAFLIHSVLVIAAVAMAWLQPTRVYECAPAGQGTARCVLGERLLGLFPLGTRVVEGVAAAAHEEGVETSVAPADGATGRTVSTRFEGLELTGVAGERLWGTTSRHVVGASLADVAAGVNRAAAGDGGTFVAWNAPWPLLLVASLFLLLATSELGTLAGLALIRRDLLPPEAHRAVYWGPTLLVAALLLLAWGVAFAGADPPAGLAAWLSGGW